MRLPTLTFTYNKAIALQKSSYQEKYVNKSMLKLLSEFLRSPRNFSEENNRQRIVIISLSSLLFLGILLSMAKGTVRQRNAAIDPDVTSTTLSRVPTQTNWWVRHEPSEIATNLLSSFQTPTVGAEQSMALNKCPAYAADFKPGSFGYISPFPPYENLARAGAGKNYPSVGFIEIGDWLKILAEPICDDSGYVWLNVQWAAGSSEWTAGGYKAAQWVIPCPDPKKKCSKKRATGSISATPNAENNGNSHDDNNSKDCVSDKLAAGRDAQVSPNDLLVVRTEPLIGSVLGRIAPSAVVHIIDGPKCAGGGVWRKVLSQQTGWAVENNLRACPMEGDCNPWKDE
jgi:hypothetical protein